MNNEIMKVAIPPTRNPFVNAQLVKAGRDPVTGEERFWTSALNHIDGCVGALVTRSGRHRLYRFDPGKGESHFYGAVYTGDEVMWLTTFLNTITRLDLKTGRTESFETGMPRSLSVSGLTYDEKTGKLFQMAYCQDDMTRKGYSFDTVARTISKTFDNIPINGKQLRFTVSNKDGTYSLFCSGPEVDILIWNPEDDSLKVVLKDLEMGLNLRMLDYAVVMQRSDGAVFLPAHGWFDPLKGHFVDGPMPLVDAAWFASDAEYAYGSRTMFLGNTLLYRWNMETGEIRLLNEIPDAITYSFRLTNDNKIVCVNMYGFFYRIDSVTGAIEASVKFDSDGIGRIDCVYRISDERLLCTPFITQRFYETNLITGKASDLGRATGGMGEVLEVTGMNGKVYMASYTKGQLVEYDPDQPAHFPENPRIVTVPRGRAMRPVAMCRSEKTIFYSCSHEYGFLGSTLVSYTPSAGESRFVENPIPNHMIRSLEYDDRLNKLIAATTYHGDCKSCVPEDDSLIIALIEPETMLLERSIRVDTEQEYFHIFGELSDSCYLCGASNAYEELEKGFVFFNFDAGKFRLESYELPSDLTAQNLQRIYYAGTPGIFIIVTDENIDVWNLNTGEFVKTLCENPGVYRTIVQDDIVYLVCKREIHIVHID